MFYYAKSKTISNLFKFFQHINSKIYLKYAYETKKVAALLNESYKTPQSAKNV